MLTTETITAQDWIEYAEGYSRYHWAALCGSMVPSMRWHGGQLYSSRHIVAGTSFPEFYTTARLDVAIRFAQTALGREFYRHVRYPVDVPNHKRMMKARDRD